VKTKPAESYPFLLKSREWTSPCWKTWFHDESALFDHAEVHEMYVENSGDWRVWLWERQITSKPKRKAAEHNKQLFFLSQESLTALSQETLTKKHLSIKSSPQLG